MSDKIRIAIIDDHSLFRDGLKSIFATEPDYEVVGESEDGEQGLEMIRSTQPDVVLLDISIPGISGLEVCRQITTQFPMVSTIMVTMHHSDEFISNAFSAGASGYVLKQSAVDELIAAIKAVQVGKKYISVDITSPVLERYMKEVEENPASRDHLSARENEIIRLIAQGWETQRIGEALHISPATIKTHRNTIMKKLGVHKSIDLVKYALKSGLIELE